MVGPAIVWDSPRDDDEELPPNSDCNAISRDRIAQSETAGIGNQGELFTEPNTCAGMLTVARTVFENNRAGSAGAARLVAHYDTSGALLEDLTVRNNASTSIDCCDGKGGGVSLEVKSGAGLIRNSTFEGNGSNHEGGGLYVNSERPISIVDNRFANNTSWRGGAVALAWRREA